MAGCLFVGLVLHTLAASALAVQTPTDGSGPDRQLEVVLGHVETELSGHPRIIHGPVAHTEKWGLAEVTYVLPVREAEPTADKSPVFVEAQLIAHGQQAPNRLVRQRAAWAYRPSPMQYHPKHAWRSLRSPRYRAIRTATYQPKHSWTYCPTDFRYTPAPKDMAFRFYTGIGQPSSFSAESPKDFYEIVTRVAVESLEFHLYRKDFENWIKNALKDSELAEEFAKLRAMKLKGEDLRKEMMKTLAATYGI